MTSNPPLNSKLLYLPLREVQIYLNNLEAENEKLKSELTSFSRFNCILENIRRSANKGFNALQIIDKNKSCVCNEHLNGSLRRVAQEAEIELKVWQEQYDKLMLTNKQTDSMSTHEDNNNNSLSPRSSTGVISPVHSIHSAHSPRPETTHNQMDLSSFNRNHSPVMRTASISMDSISTTDSGFRSDFSERSNHSPIRIDDKLKGINNEINSNKSMSPPLDDSSMDRSTPLVVYESRKESRLICDWPNCNKVFVNEDILNHHRRNHIRKSIYSCEFCSTRLLSKEELDNHMKKHILKSEPEFDREREEEELIIVEEEEEMTQNIENSLKLQKSSTEVVNLSKPQNQMIRDTHNTTLNSITTLTNIQNNERVQHLEKSIYQTVLYERLTAKQPVPPPSLNRPPVPVNDPSKISQHLNCTEEYKRTRYSGVGRYRCPWPDCGYTPHFLRDLRRHMYKHTGDKKHKCDYPGCDFVSVWKTSLLQHQRKKHFAVNPMNTNNSFDTRIPV